MTETTPSVNFPTAVKLFFTNYVNFKGRARRSEYWWAILFVNIITFGVGNLLPEAAGIWMLVTVLPCMSLFVRRLHDIGLSGWFYLLSFIPFLGMYWCCLDSKDDNKWGPNPKRVSSGYGYAENAALPGSDAYSGYNAAGGSNGSTMFTPSPAPSITLSLCTGPMAGTSYSCTPGSYATLGRAPSRCEIVLDQQYNMVSGVHCRIQFYDQYATVTDLNSTNGTYVNGTRLTPGQPVTVQNGAAIYLASSACAFQIYFN